MKHSPIRDLSNFLATLHPSLVPKEVKAQARLCLLDTIGCMISGSTTDAAQRIAAAELAANPGKQCSIAGGKRGGLLSAARINAYQGDIFELNDLIAGHASIGNVAAALALGQVRRVSGETLEVALVAGIETTARVYGAFYPYQKSLEEVGMVSVGMPSAIGSAAACARILDLSPSQTADALAIAAAWANWCPAEVIFGDGRGAKPMLFGGLPANAGISAALAAEQGISGPPDILSSAMGFFATVATQWSSDPFHSSTWALSQPRRKLHACCGYIHSAYDAALDLRKAEGFDISDILDASVEVPAYTIPAIRKNHLPTTANEARFHLQYMLAHAFTGLEAVTPATSEAFEAECARPELLGLFDKIRVEPGAGLRHYHQSRLTVTLVDGRTFSVANDAPRGSDRNPLGDDAIVEKFRNLSGPVMGESRTERLIALCLGLSNLPEIGTLCTALEHPTKARSVVKGTPV